MNRYSSYPKFVHRIAAAVLALVVSGFAMSGHADVLSSAHDDAFYHQLLKLPTARGYLTTRSFTIVVDTEHGNRFNLLWMEQFRPGYRATRGGSAFGEVVRSYLKLAYKAYRDSNAQAMAALPDENGSIHAAANATNFIDAMDYNLKITGDEVRFKIQYNY